MEKELEQDRGMEKHTEQDAEQAGAREVAAGQLRATRPPGLDGT
jgi:hypothetical protein